MIAWLKTLDLDIEATAEDHFFHDRLPEIEANDVVLGTLNPQLRKFLSLIDKRQTQLEKTAQELRALPIATQELRIGEIAKLNEEVATLIKIFWIETADEITRTTNPNMWNMQLFFSVKKGWTVVGSSVDHLAGQGHPMVFVAVGNPENMDDLQDESAEMPEPPKGKRTLN